MSQMMKGRVARTRGGVASSKVRDQRNVRMQAVACSLPHFACVSAIVVYLRFFCTCESTGAASAAEFLSINHLPLKCGGATTSAPGAVETGTHASSACLTPRRLP